MTALLSAAVVLFCVLGAILSTGHGSLLLAALLMLTPKEREHLKTKEFCRFMGGIMFGYGAGFGLMLLRDLYGLRVLFYLAIGVFIGMIGMTVSAMNSGKFYNP